MEPARKQEVINVCLETFMKKGLAHTPTRDLCAALNLNTGGVFYYFKTKDEIIIACAEEATLRIERDLLGVALNDIGDPKKLMSSLRDRANAMRPLMQFFVSVSACPQYTAALQPIFKRLAERYDHYAERFAEVLCCDPKEVAPYIYSGINTMLSYMLFGQESFSAPQLGLIYNALNGFLEKRDRGREMSMQ